MSLKGVAETLLVLDEKASKIKRPMNAFMLWSKQRRREISKNDPTIHNAQISKLLGEEWKVLSLEEKQPFLRESQKLMVKHKKEHPDYRYKPRKIKQDNVRGFGTNKSCALPPQGKPYSKYNTQHHYSSPRRGYYSDEISRISSMPKHRSMIYYQSYGECHVPGCYECEYQRPYEHPRDTMYCCHNDIPKECQSMKSHCLCCSPSPSFIPRSNSGTPTSPKSRSKSFTVESLIHERQSPHHLGHSESPYSSPSSSSPASTSPTREVQRGFRRQEESYKQGSVSTEN